MPKNLKFTSAEWQKINNYLSNQLQTESEPFGLPSKREKSVVMGTFNIRELGTVDKRSHEAWEFLTLIAKQFDLLAIQEVQDDLAGIRELRKRLGDEWGLVVSDTTGKTPGRRGSAERLAFLFNWKRVRRTELASDISYDRTTVVDTLFENRSAFSATWQAHQQKLEEWEAENAVRVAQGKKKKSKPVITLPTFLTFIRQPHCASFEVIPIESSTDKPYEFLVVNAHLLYGKNEEERRWEFDALIEWLALRAKSKKTTYYENILMMGDCNLEFKDANTTRQEIETWLKTLNKSKLKSKKAAKANFPLIDPHPNPNRNPLRTNARQDQTYDQIALFTHDPRLPTYEANETAGTTPDAYDYGVFKFTDLFAAALFDAVADPDNGKGALETLSQKKQKWIISRTEWDISDHMPAWFRLPIPGA